ncbi:helix-turn-helix domain-containing protein [Microbispora triticiradicis]|uniref:Helix-turn-helix domain-containing protein n=1 Tax=Microbispora triticiradicis TaxID=2200763 RepID=A0A5R8Z1H6_9ACTN|nr:helix-turn-helix domain-containing protein [Microbispora fusca]
MRYAQGGGFTPQEQRRREEVRLRAAEMFEQGVTNAAVAKTLRVTQRSVERWRRAWREGGTAALASAGPHVISPPPARPLGSGFAQGRNRLTGGGRAVLQHLGRQCLADREGTADGGSRCGRGDVCRRRPVPRGQGTRSTSNT